MLVTELLEQNAALYGENVALVSIESDSLIPFDDASYASHRSSISWREFNEKANQVANFYNANGIGKGNKVGLLMRNCIEWLPIYFGIIKSGAVVVPLNFRYETADIVWAANFVELDALIFDQKCAKQVKMSIPKLPRLHSYIFVGPEKLCPPFAAHFKIAFDESAKNEPNHLLTPQDDVAIYFSSGTTGIPKAVVYTNATLEASCILEQHNHGQTRDDCFICIPPLYHVGAKFHWMGNLLVGAKGVLLLGFTVSAFFEAMSREQVTISFLLFPWAQDILLSLDSKKLMLSRYSLVHWRMIHMGAQPIPPSVVTRLQSYFPQLAYDISYGLTESGGPGCFDLGANNIRKGGSIGRPSAGWKAMVVDDCGKEVRPGEPGELLVQGSAMMRCYYKNEAATRSALTDGWLHTGDVVMEDADGFYYLIDRKKDIIISGGENIYPAEIEDFLRLHESVKDVAVFGIHHCRLGEAVVALVELNPGAFCTERDLLDFCSILPRYKRPKRVLLGKVPRNQIGKIEKAKLRSRYAKFNFLE